MKISSSTTHVGSRSSGHDGAMTSATRGVLLAVAAAIGLTLALLGITHAVTGNTETGPAPPAEVRIGESAPMTPGTPAPPRPAPLRYRRPHCLLLPCHPNRPRHRRPRRRHLPRPSRPRNRREPGRDPSPAPSPHRRGSRSSLRHRCSATTTMTTTTVGAVTMTDPRPGSTVDLTIGPGLAPPRPSTLVIPSPPDTEPPDRSSRTSALAKGASDPGPVADHQLGHAADVRCAADREPGHPPGALRRSRRRGQRRAGAGDRGVRRGRRRRGQPVHRAALLRCRGTPRQPPAASVPRRRRGGGRGTARRQHRAAGARGALPVRVPSRAGPRGRRGSLGDRLAAHRRR